MHVSFSTDQAEAAPLEIQASGRSYLVRVQQGLLAEVIAQAHDQVFIVDDYLKQPLLDAGLDPIVIVADETIKSLQGATEVIIQMRERRATRGTTLVAIGGGVVQDVAAFAASTYMRGIPWRYVPSTLLSMADSCIGGKSSINVGHYKNIVGTIHPPMEVLVDPSLTETLSAEQMAAGLCEAAKICLCRGLEEFDAYLALGPAVDVDAETLRPVIARSLSAKKWFIEIDEFDKAERLVLNFGHTFGHAIEAATHFRIAHGVAVGLGMLAAITLGEEIGRDYSRIPQISRFRAHIEQLLAAAGDIDSVLQSVSSDALIDAFLSDKKHARDTLVVIVPSDAGAVERITLPRTPPTIAPVERAFQSLQQRQTLALLAESSRR